MEDFFSTVSNVKKNHGIFFSILKKIQTIENQLFRMVIPAEIF